MAIALPGKAISSARLTLKRDSFGLRTLTIKISYVLLHQIDLVLTVIAVSLGLSELNPLMRHLLATPLQLVLIKLVIPVLIAWFIPVRFLIPAAVFLFLIVIWNIKELLIVLI